jgi:hypothetical protein
MLSKYTSSKEKQAETPKSNGAPTGPGVAPWADDDQRSRFFRGKEENSKSAKRAMELINEEVSENPVSSNPVSKRFSFYNVIPATQSTDSYLSEDESGNIEYTPQAKKNLESAKELMETDAATRFNLQSNPEADSFENGYIQPYQFPISQEYMYGGYYAFGGDLPEYQGSVTDTKGSTVTADPKMQPSLNKYAQTAIDNLTKIPSRRDIGAGVGALEPRKVTESESIVDDQGLVNVGQTPQAELEGKTQSQKVKVKNEYDINPEAALNTFNAAANTGLGMIERYQNAKANNMQLANYMADNLYATNEHRNRGTYETNSGLFRPDEMGFTGVVKYGGPIYAEGGEAYMTQEEIDDFIANGGELEYLND